MKSITRGLLASAFFCTSAISQPVIPVVSWDGNQDPFIYRSFENQTFRVRGTPIIIDKNIEYFKSRRLEFEIKGETSITGKIYGRDASGNLRFEGTYLRNQLYGPARTFHTNGATRDSGLIVMNLPHGEWKFFNTDGSLMSVRHYDAYMWWQLQWSIELRNPAWNWFELSELYFKKPYAFHDAVDGRASFNDKFSPLFAHCVQQGLQVNYYENGMVSDSGYFYKGVKDGVWFQYHANGELKESGAWKLGQRVGTWKNLYPSGNLSMLRVYKYGKVSEKKEYFQ